jgi:FkbM family methyltransferase
MSFFDAAASNTPLLAVESVHGAFVVSTADAKVGRTVFVKGQYATGQLSFVLDLLEREGWPAVRDGRLLDVGANIGTVTVTALRRERMAGAIAVEPHPDNVRLLRMNVIYNDLDKQVTVLPVALSDRDDIGRLKIVSRRNSGSYRVVQAAPDGKTIEVPLRTLDGFEADGVAPFGDVSLLWMDVQGHEPHVLAGAQRLLARSTPVVTEFYPAVLRRNGTLEPMLELIRRHFTRFVELRSLAVEGQALVDIAALEGIVDPLGDRFTDLLLVPGCP